MGIFIVLMPNYMVRERIGIPELGTGLAVTVSLCLTRKNAWFFPCYYLPELIALDPGKWWMDTKSGANKKMVPRFFAMTQLINDFNDFIDLRDNPVADRDHLQARVDTSLKNIETIAPELLPTAHSYIDQTRCLETHIRSIPHPHIGDAIRYRELLNAVGLMHVSSIFLDPRQIDLSSMIFENSSLEKIESAYAWLTQYDVKPASGIERNLQAYQRLFMGCQFINDFEDLVSNTEFHIPSLATIFNRTISEKDRDKDKEKVKSILGFYAQNYFKESEDLGISKLASTLISKGYRAYKQLSHLNLGFKDYRAALLEQAKTA